MPDSLDKLIVDDNTQPDIDLLAKIVESYIRLTKSGQILFEKKFYALSEAKKIVLYLLARKIIKIKKLAADFNEEVKTKEISEALGVKESNVRKYLSTELKEVTKGIKGAYCVPNYDLYKCDELIKHDNRKRSS